LGSNSLLEILNKAEKLSYEYIGISDHNPSIGNHSQSQIIAIMKRRKDYYEQIYSSYKKSTHNPVQLFIMLEIDIMTDGTLALPKPAFDYIDAAIASVHSSFNQDRITMTERIIKGLTGNPKIRIFGHPTGRLLGKREGYDLDWNRIFTVMQEQNMALEINAFPVRLDLPDKLVLDSVRKGIKCIINTDSHATDQMDMMKYGISVARRGWAAARDIINTMGYNQIAKWLIK
jgi:DNA polymerase (family 10)